MEINILKNTKDELKAEIGNLTIAEILRVYLNKDGHVTFVAWRRENLTKKPVLLVKTKGKTARKAVNDAVSEIIKDLDKVDDDFKNLK